MKQHENEFEKNLKLHTENYVMYPSENVWAGLQKQLHINNRTPYQKRYAVLALMVAGIVLGNFFVHNEATKNNDTLLKIAKQFNRDNNSIIKSNNVPTNQIGNIINPKQNTVTKSNFKSETTRASSLNYDNNNLKNSLPIASLKQKVWNDNIVVKDLALELKDVVLNKEDENMEFNTATSEGTINEGNELKLSDKKLTYNIESATPKTKLNFGATNKKAKIDKEVEKTIIKDYLNKETAQQIDKKLFAKKQNKGWQLNVIIVPTMSNVRIVNKAAYGNLNTVRKFNNLKPKIGVELGAQLQYNKNKISYLIGGQVNVYGNKFTAYDANGLERTMARSTLSLNTNTFDSSYSFLRTVGGKENANEYKNSFVSVSMPMGINYNMAKVSNKINLYVAGMVAPSLLLYANNYTMSADLKNYIKAPDQLRKWNVSGILSTYVEFGGKNTSIQLGPQLSYQLFNIYKQDYHIKEVSKDLGLRLGIVKKF